MIRRASQYHIDWQYQWIPDCRVYMWLSPVCSKHIISACRTCFDPIPLPPVSHLTHWIWPPVSIGAKQRSWSLSILQIRLKYKWAERLNIEAHDMMSWHCNATLSNEPLWAWGPSHRACNAEFFSKLLAFISCWTNNYYHRLETPITLMW